MTELIVGALIALFSVILGLIIGVLVTVATQNRRDDEF